MKVKFNIINMVKEDSLYNNGLKPIIFSQRNYQKTGKGWFRGGSNISYAKNDYKRNIQAWAQRFHSYIGLQRETMTKEQKNKTFYTLNFSYTFEYENDSVYFAHCFPYTYSDLVSDMRSLEEKALVSNWCRIERPMRSYLGNKI